MTRYLTLSQPPERDDTSETAGLSGGMGFAPAVRANGRDAHSGLPSPPPAAAGAADFRSQSLTDRIDVLAGLEHLPARKLRRMIRLRLARLRAERLVADLWRGS